MSANAVPEALAEVRDRVSGEGALEGAGFGGALDHTLWIACTGEVRDALIERLCEFACAGPEVAFGECVAFLIDEVDGCVRLFCDFGVWVELEGPCRVVLVRDDALLGGVTISSRWSRVAESTS